MSKTKKSSAPIWAGLLCVLTLTWWSCTCPPSTPCANPNPMVGVDEDGGYLVRVDSVPGAVNAVIYSITAQGQPFDTVTLPVGNSHVYFFPHDSLYPVQLNFFYMAPGGGVVAQDELRLGNIDNNSGGIAAMDVVMGLSTPNPAPSTPPSCPNTSLIATGTGEVVFSWTNNDWFDVSITHEATVKKIGIQTKDGPPGHPGFINVYRTDIYSCLDNPNCQVAQNLQICSVPISQSGTSILTGLNDGTVQQIKLTGAGCSFVVKKKQ